MSYTNDHTLMDVDLQDNMEITKSDCIVRIGHKNFNFNYLTHNFVWNQKYSGSHPGTERYYTVFPEPSAQETMIHAEIEESPIETFNFVMQQCLRNHYLMMRLAYFLSTKTVDAICQHVFTAKGIHPDFLIDFYQCFLPVFLSRRYTWFSLTIMFRAKKAYPHLMKKLIMHLVKDVNITSNILHDFVCNMNPNYKKTFMEILCEMNMDMYEFAHNIPCIYAAVKDTVIDENIYQFLFTNLDIHSDFCIYNKNYGKLLLFLIENLSGHNVRFRVIKCIIEKHCTSYKNICTSMLEKYINELIAIHFNLQETSRYTIPRPEEASRL